MAGPVQQTANSSASAATTLALTLGATPSASSLFLLFAAFNSATGTVSSIAQTAVSWAALSGARSHTARDATWWIGTPTGGTPGTGVTVTFSITSLSRAAHISEWAGYTAVQDTTAVVKTATSTNPTTNSITTVTAKTLLLAGVNDSTAATTATGSFTDLTGDTTQTGAKLSAAYREVVATGSYSTGWTASAGSWDDVLIALRLAKTRSGFVNFQDPGWMFKTFRPQWRPRRSGLIVPTPGIVTA